MFAQKGTSSAPFTSLDQICVSTAGIYFFNLGGTTFSSYIDANGYILVAYDPGGAATNTDLQSKTALTNSARGILSTTVLASLTGIKKVRISTSDGKVNAVTTNAAIISRVNASKSLNDGAADNTINGSWVNSGTLTASFNGATATPTSSTSLAKQVIYPSGSFTSVHWMPNLPSNGLSYRREIWNSGDVPTSVSFNLWVQGSSSIPSAPTTTAASACEGSSITLSGSSCASPAALTWYSESALTNTISATQTINSTSTFYAACENGLCKSAAASVKITAITSVTAPSISSTNTIVCSGSSASITASGCTGGSIKWNTGADGETLTINPANATTTYTATCTILGTSPCPDATSTTTGTITVNNLPTSTILLAPICTNTSEYIFAFSTTNGSSDVISIDNSLSATFNASLPNSSSGWVVRNVPIGVSPVVTITDGKGCKNTLNVNAPACDVLPVKLKQFSGFSGKGVVELNWTTNEESKIDFYEIEKSDNAKDFATIGKVSSNAHLANNLYSFLDVSPSLGFNYYRLKVHELNDKPWLSEIVQVKYLNSQKDNWIIFPNPIEQQISKLTINFSVENQLENVQAIDVTSQKVTDLNFTKINNFQYLVDLSTLPNVTYILNIKTNKLTDSKRFLIIK